MLGVDVTVNKKSKRKKAKQKLKVTGKLCRDCGGTKKTGHKKLCKSGLEKFRRRCYVRYFQINKDENAAMRFSIFPGGKVYLTYVKATSLVKPEQFEVSERTIASLELMPKHAKQLAKAILNKSRQ